MKKKLSTLRQLHIVHADSKPDNILYSPGWKNVVLVDFGLALIVKESVNEETETGFFGTPHFAGEEMKYLHKYKTKGFVNLYKNDHQSLLKTAKEMFDLRVSNLLKNTSRTKDGYFLYKFW